MNATKCARSRSLTIVTLALVAFLLAACSGGGSDLSPIEPLAGIDSA